MMFKVKNKNTRMTYLILHPLKTQENNCLVFTGGIKWDDVVLVSLYLTLNTFYIFFKCFYC